MSRGLHYYFSSNLYTPAPKMSYPNDKRRFRVICNLKTLACLAVSSRNFMKALKKHFFQVPFITQRRSDFRHARHKNATFLPHSSHHQFVFSKLSPAPVSAKKSRNKFLFPGNSNMLNRLLAAQQKCDTPLFNELVLNSAKATAVFSNGAKNKANVNQSSAHPVRLMLMTASKEYLDVWYLLILQLLLLLGHSALLQNAWQAQPWGR